MKRPWWFPRSLWRAHLRRIDTATLWPACLEAAAGSRETALDAFALHMAADPLYDDFDAADGVAFLARLP